MGIRLAALFSLALQLVLLQGAIAQSSPPQLTDEQQNEINLIIGQAINGITVFSSQSTISSGSFTIRYPGSDPDTHFEVYRLPFGYDFQEVAGVTPFLEGNLGMLHIVEKFPPVEGDGPNDFSAIDSLSAALGGGVHFSPIENLVISPGLLFSYSNTRNRFDYNNDFSQQVLQPYGKQLYDWRVDTMTYIPSLRVDYEVALGRPKILLWSKYSHLYNDSISTNSPTIDISSDTSLWQNSIGIRTPLSVTLWDLPLSDRIIVTRTDIYKDGRVGLTFRNFYEVTFDFILDMDKKNCPIRELSLGASQFFGDDFHGWRLGLGFAL